jgi:FKBP-type peptidyl-prolyl cis-trans isomerase
MKYSPGFIATLVLFSLFSTVIFGQKMTSPGGLEYNLLRHSKDARKAMPGDFMAMYLNYAVQRNGVDSIVFSSAMRDAQGKMLIQITESTYKGDIIDALAQLSLGDSARIVVRADSFFINSVKTPKLPPFVRSNEMLYFNVGVAELMNEKELAQKQAEAEAKEQAEMMTLKEKQITELQKYFAEKGIPAEQDENGLFIAVIDPGLGIPPSSGKTVNVHYTGTLINGSKFDSSVDRGQPFSFALGKGEVIQGWDLGIAKLKPGGKAILGIPSYLGYGSRSMGKAIPANSILIFEVQLISYE